MRTIGDTQETLEALLPALDPKIVAHLVRLQDEVVGKGYAGSPGTAPCIASIRELTKVEFRKIAELIRERKLPIRLTYRFVSDYYVEVFDHRIGEDGKLVRVFLFINTQIPFPAAVERLRSDECTEAEYRYFMESIGNGPDYSVVLSHYGFPELPDEVPSELVY